MKTKLKSVCLFGATLALFAIASCNKDEAPVPVQPANSTTIKNDLVSPVKEDDYLVFRDQDNLLAYQKEYMNKKVEDQDNWEKSLSFISYRKLFNEALNEMEGVETQEQYNSLKAKYSSLVKFTEDGTIDTKYMPNYAPFINKDGIVKVGGILYKLTEDRMIFIMDGDKSKINAALNYSESRPDQNVMISHIEKTARIDKNESTARAPYWDVNEQVAYNNGFSGNGNDKLEVWVYFYRSYIPVSPCGWSVSVYLNINLKSSTKNGFGGWKEKKCTLSPAGGYSIDVVTPPLAQSCNGLPYMGGALRANNSFDFGFDFTSNRTWQIYGGGQIWNYVNSCQNIIVGFWSNSYSQCLGYSVAANI